MCPHLASTGGCADRGRRPGSSNRRESGKKQPLRNRAPEEAREVQLTVELPVLVAREIGAVPVAEIEDAPADERRGVTRDVVRRARRRVRLPIGWYPRRKPVEWLPVLVACTATRSSRTPGRRSASRTSRHRRMNAGRMHVVGVQREDIRARGSARCPRSALARAPRSAAVSTLIGNLVASSARTASSAAASRR